MSAAPTPLRSRYLTLVAAAAWALAAAPLPAGEIAGVTEPWPAPVAGHVPVKPGEHPRLIFRKADVAELRRRAATPEGKAILARCEKMLAERFTTWNAAAHAFLYQVTGDKAHAAKARTAAEQMMAGAGNPDGRYTYLRPGGQLRAGPVLGGMGLAYDMAYDGWEPDFRRRVAENIVRHPLAAQVVNRPAHGPGCNHFGAHQGGMGLAVLALRGDPELADAKLVEGWLDKLVESVKRELTIGHGPGGHYYEGHHCGRISSNTGVIPFIQAYRVAAGKDLVANCTHAQWLVTQWVYEFVRFGGQCRNIQRGMYGRDPFPRGGMLSMDGDFAQGFGICPAEHKPAVLWAYNHLLEPPDQERTYDIWEYPHLAAYALANWPLGMKETNPGELLPKVRHDPGPGYFVFRSAWTGGDDDVVVTAILGSTPGGGRGMAHGGSVAVLGLGGVKAIFPGMFTASRMTYFKAEKDGSGVLSAVPIPDSRWKILKDDPPKRLGPPAPVLLKIRTGVDPLAVRAEKPPSLADLGLEDLEDKKPTKPAKKAEPVKAPPPGPTYGKVTSLAVDYSGACGAPCLVAMVGPQAGYGVAYWMHVIPGRIDDAKADNGANTKTAVLKAGPEVFYVMTVQKGDPPSVRAAGEKVVVGGRTIAFDGEKLVLGTPGGP